MRWNDVKVVVFEVDPPPPPPRHTEIIIEQLELHGANAVVIPEVEGDDVTASGSTQPFG